MSDTAALLAQLRDIRVPAPPPEPALWPVLAILLALVSGLLYLLRRWLRRRNRWAVDAIIRINSIQQQNPDNAIDEYACLLKQIAVTVKDESGIQHLHGQAWLHFLDDFFSTRFFSSDAGQIFGDSLYHRPHTGLMHDQQIGEHLKRLIRRRRFRPC